MEIDRLKTPGTDTESYTVHTTEDLLHLTEELHKSGRVKGVGYDVFGTLLTSLYTRTEQSAFLAKQLAIYLRQNSLGSITDEEATTQYERVREEAKLAIRHRKNDIPPKEVECPETEVLSKIGELYKVSKIGHLVRFVQDEWLKYDLANTKPVVGMVDVVKASIEVFGQRNVGIFTNNSCSKEHLEALLYGNGFVGNCMLIQKNVFVSSETGLRKPNMDMFTNFSNQLSTDPLKMMFVGDGNNDVLFATNSCGVGIRVSLSG